MKTKEDRLVIGRRNALKMLGLGSAAMLTAGFKDITAAESRDTKPKPKFSALSGNSSVSFTAGSDRKQNMSEVIKPFEKEIREGLKGKQLIIKPNMVVTNNPICATHVDALRGLLEFLKPIYHKQIIIGESSSTFNSSDGFKNYGYLDLEKEYNVKFVNLNGTSGSPINIIDRNLHLDTIQLIKEFVNPENYIISISRLKTHNTVIMTGGTKNMCMGAPLFLQPTEGKMGVSYKRNMHAGGPRWCHYNIYLVAHSVRPDFTIIDGVEGMEGNGPIAGTAVTHNIALAGHDVIAVDSMCCRLMGIPLDEVGYLNYCAADGLGNIDREKIDIIGSAKPEDHIIQYKQPTNFSYQIEWKDPLNIPQPPRPPAQAPANQQQQPSQPATTPAQQPSAQPAAPVQPPK